MKKLWKLGSRIGCRKKLLVSENVNNWRDKDCKKRRGADTHPGEAALAMVERRSWRKYEIKEDDLGKKWWEPDKNISRQSCGKTSVARDKAKERNWICYSDWKYLKNYKGKRKWKHPKISWLESANEDNTKSKWKELLSLENPSVMVEGTPSIPLSPELANGKSTGPDHE